MITNSFFDIPAETRGRRERCKKPPCASASLRENIQSALLGVYDSQISGGKRYDLAAVARRRAAATYSQSHRVDTATALSTAMDLTPLLRDVRIDPGEYVGDMIDRFRKEVLEKMERFL